MDSEAGFSDMTRRGFPHSDICASTPACGSTQLIAANHVLRRLLTPRHPPSALSSLTTSLSVRLATSLRGQDQGSLFENVLPLSTQRISHALRYYIANANVRSALRPTIQLSIPT